MKSSKRKQGTLVGWLVGWVDWLVGLVGWLVGLVGLVWVGLGWFGLVWVGLVGWLVDAVVFIT